MKNAKKLLFALVAFLAVTGVAHAQYLEDDRYGSTVEERKQNALILNYFNDAYTANDYDLALGYLPTLLNNIPKASVNVYIRASNIYKAKITQATTLPERNKYVDSLMYVYDMRAENMATDERDKGLGFILTSKANDFLVYRPMDRENLQQFFLDAIEATEGKDPTVINRYFNILAEDYDADLIETDFLMEEYDRLEKYFVDASTPEMEEGQRMLEAQLLSSGAADCEKLELLYKPRYEADPTNAETMTKIVTMMTRANCNSDFMLAVTESLYKVQPDAQTAVYLADIFERRGDYEKSLYYWQESINTESDPAVKATYTIRAATSALGSNNYRQAIAFAREALEVDPENGLAYMIIGQCYAMSAPSACNDTFEKQAAYWLVIDNLQRARSLLSGDSAQVETLTSQINTYSLNFPSKEDCFFRNLNNGDPYPVNCGWVSGRTTVRVGR